MFQFQPSISEGDALKKRIDSKDTDSTPEQPENTEVVNVSEDTPEPEIITEDNNNNTESETEELAPESDKLEVKR